MSDDKTTPPQCRSDAPGFAADPELPCDKCGKFGAYAWDGATLCLRCYTEQGSCCAEREEPDIRPPATRDE